MPTVRRAAALAVTGLLLGTGCSEEAPPLSRQEEVAARGAQVMRFDLDRTTHVFVPQKNGGVQRVVSDAPNDAEQIALVRSHLRKEAAAFARGDFTDPAAIHGHQMPGLARLRRSYAAIEVDYSDIPAGGVIRYRSSNRAVVRALHRWFAAQVSDHGAHAEHGRRR